MSVGCGCCAVGIDELIGIAVDAAVDIQPIARSEEHCCHAGCVEKLRIYVALACHLKGGCVVRNEIAASYALRDGVETSSALIGMVAFPA